MNGLLVVYNVTIFTEIKSKGKVLIRDLKNKYGTLIIENEIVNLKKLDAIRTDNEFVYYIGEPKLQKIF
ncbi:hypothetical protein [Clostridium scatologenes]|uniref:Uncharacterized protein n=1 Tax=Clostridium scatologenes TaxID=1548 RepID=A0A0E3JQT5_CLOSL|nr:hypothetical protein [Clostridium scatologenes]AKA71210.1 hypothetical protein CSCA_4085 [Clostridium scatologenes]